MAEKPSAYSREEKASRRNEKFKDLNNSSLENLILELEYALKRFDEGYGKRLEEMTGESVMLGATKCRLAGERHHFEAIWELAFREGQQLKGSSDAYQWWNMRKRAADEKAVAPEKTK